MNDLNWETINNDPLFSKNPNKLAFFNDKGVEASETEDAVTHELEFVRMEAVSPEDAEKLKISNPKKAPVVKFTFVDLKENIEKEVIRTTVTRFFDALRKAQPKPGEKIKIMRTGSKFSVAYFVQKIQSQPAQTE